MSDPTVQSPRSGVLVKPTYGYVGPSPARPGTRQVLVEWFDSINCVRDPTRFLPAAWAFYHVMTGGVFVVFVARYFSVASVAAVIAIAVFVGTIYNTVWYHRFCSHQAFRFRSIWFTRLFLWSNPISFREECYVLPHRIHHSRPDEPGDPYGPHLGWLGSYLATETQQKTNRNMSRAEYDRVARSLRHIGFVENSFEQFQRTGSVEHIWHYGARVLSANLLWSALMFAYAGWQGVLAWGSGVFLSTFVLRDFNFRGHAGLFGTNTHGSPLNQVFYGITAGEWHENHHHYPGSARSGREWWQIDLPYLMIRGMRACGVVTHYNKAI